MKSQLLLSSILVVVKLCAGNSEVEEEEENFYEVHTTKPEIPSLRKIGLPICQNVPKNDPRSPTGFDLQCFCDGSSRRYNGALTTFLRTAIRRMRPFVYSDENENGRRKHNISVMITNCRQLKLDLNFGNLLYTNSIESIKLKILDVNRLHINHVDLAFNKSHILELEGIRHRASLTGRIECFKCPNATNSPSTNRLKLPASFSIEVKNSKQISLYNVESLTPIGMSVLNASGVYVTRSMFESISWPGFFFYNVTKVVITKNEFKDIATQGLVAKLGSEIILAENILNVANSLDVTQFNLMTIRCNLPDRNQIPPIDCPPFAGLPKNMVLKPTTTFHLMLVFVLSNILVYGSIWLVVVTFGAVVVTCCLCCKCKNKKRNKNTTNVQVPPKIIVHNVAEEKKMPMSILKQTPKNFDQDEKKLEKKSQLRKTDKADENNKPEKYIIVDSVSELPEDEANGVVHGSITLGGEWPKNVKKLRAVSEDTEKGKEPRSTPGVSEVNIATKQERKSKTQENERVSSPVREKDFSGSRENERLASPSRERSSSRSQDKERPTSPSSERATSPEGGESKKLQNKKKASERKSRITRSELQTLKELKLASQEEHRRLMALSDDEMSETGERSPTRKNNKKKKNSSAKSPSRNRSPSDQV